MRRLTATPSCSTGTSIRTGSSTLTPAATWTSTPSCQAFSLRATKGSSIGTSEPSRWWIRSPWELIASASGSTVAPSGASIVAVAAPAT